MTTRNGTRLIQAAAVASAGFFLLWTVTRDKSVPVVHAQQQDSWTTPAALHSEVRLIEERDSKGPAAFPIAPGDLLFFTNSGSFYGGRNTLNSVVVINAKTRKPIAVSDLDPKYTQKFGSHGIGVSPDGKYVYLPSMLSNHGPEGPTPNTVLVLDGRTLKIHQVIAEGAPPHHVKVVRLASGKQLMLVEPFDATGKGFFLMDPANDNKVVAGMTMADLDGQPYAGFSSPDGKYLYYSVPPLEFTRQRPSRLAKIDMSTWKVVQYLATAKRPLWTVFSMDGKWAWLSNSAEDKIQKIQRATAPGEEDKIVADVPVPPGPYGLRMVNDDKELWVADKGEGKPRPGSSMTVIDTATNMVTHTIQTDCLSNDHLMLSPDGSEIWGTCNASHEVVVVDTKTYTLKARIPMPNGGDSHGGSFVLYPRGADGPGEVVSDQNGLQGSVLEAALKRAAATKGR